MKVIKRTSKGYPQDPTKYFHFDRFENICSDFYLIEAAFEESDGWEQFNFSEEDLNVIKSKNLVRLEFEEPNKFFIGDKMLYDNEFFKIYTLCPYTSQWKNELHNRDLSSPIFFPFNMSYLPVVNLEKDVDVVYSGHLVSNLLISDLKRAKRSCNKFKLISNQSHGLVTDSKVSYEEKLQIYSRSKITLVHNLLFPNRKQIKEVMKFLNWEKNLAFKNIVEYTNKSFFQKLNSELPTVPQLKSRVFEAAFSKSLILCRSDDFNVIDYFFEKDLEYISYNDDNLEDVLSDILNNYPKYQGIIDRAYNKAINNYTVEVFVNKYLVKI